MSLREQCCFYFKLIIGHFSQESYHWPLTVAITLHTHFKCLFLFIKWCQYDCIMSQIEHGQWSVKVLQVSACLVSIIFLFLFNYDCSWNCHFYAENGSLLAVEILIIGLSRKMLRIPLQILKQMDKHINP